MRERRLALAFLNRGVPGTIGCFTEADATYGIHLGGDDGERRVLHAFSPALTQEMSFARWVGRSRLRRGQANIACPPAAYRLLLVEAPEVPPDEMRGAMRWKIKDLIDFHIDDSVIDVFDLPGRSARGAPRSLYVVAARRRLVQELVDQADEAGLEIQAIDIPELCLRNLVAQKGLDANGAALLYLEAEMSTLILTRERTLHFTRRIDIGYEGLTADTNVASVILEIQRSLDYCDSHLDVGRPATLYVTPTPTPIDLLLTATKTELGIDGRLLRLGDVVSHELEPEADEEARLMIAAGAALRHEERRL